ncbi:MAG TPA: ABC transporter ATP-binding protein [Acidimicrobiales bacterium]|nr:ABC transporter ATP-binding protein [Acidimicrobiales bacterium]
MFEPSRIGTGRGLPRLIRVLAAVDRRITFVVLALATLQGILLPAFTISVGVLATDLEGGGSATGAVVAIGILFTVQRLLDPLTAELTATLMRVVDESLTERVMRAMAEPPGLAHVEDPVVLDAALQAQGALSGFTPGSAALQLPFILKRRIWCVSSLLIVGTFRWWLVPVLAVTYLGVFRFERRHFQDVTLILHGNTDLLRRAYYLRTLALTHTVAKETRVFGMAPWLVDRYRSNWLEVMAGVWAKRQEYWLAILGVVGALAVVEGGALWLLAIEATSGRISVGAAVTVSQAIVAAAVAAQFDYSYVAPTEAQLALDKLLDLEQRAAAVAVRIHGEQEATQLPRRTIRFENVSFTYPGRDEPVFTGFELEIEAGRSLAIVGENGAGKTTFVKLLARLYDPDRGRIVIDGTPLTELDPASWRRRLAPVFQDFLQLEVSAYDNVAFGSLAHRSDAVRVRRAGDLAGAGVVIDRLPEGWETMVSREFTGGTQLSGGEWQRLALARALFAVESGAGVLILDEPTAAMDVRGEAEVYERFLELTKGVTTIVISHRFSTVRRADRIVVVEDGRVTEDGNHEELLAVGGRYAAMYRLQAARFSEGRPGA